MTIHAKTIVLTCTKCGHLQEVTAHGLADFELVGCRRCREPIGRWGDLRSRKPC